jgi:uncharacterized protein
MECTIYRCSKQAEMYLYLRAELAPETLPEALRQRAGRLTRVMDLQLSADRKLARVDVRKVMERVAAEGWYLQLPPNGQMHGHLHFGD